MARGKINGTVSRKDITLRENVIEEPAIGDWIAAKTYSHWEATFDGELPSGETLTMSREAFHAGEALLLLEEALNELGLELR